MGWFIALFAALAEADAVRGTGILGFGFAGLARSWRCPSTARRS